MTDKCEVLGPTCFTPELQIRRISLWFDDDSLFWEEFNYLEEVSGGIIVHRS
jgi:hypothetical protein